MRTESLYIKVYDEVLNITETSTTLNLLSVGLDNKIQKESVTGDRKIVEETISGRSTPYLYGVEKSPLTFNASFLLNKGATQEDINKVLSFFLKDYYLQIQFSSSYETRQSTGGEYLAEDLSRYVPLFEDNGTRYNVISTKAPEVEYIHIGNGKKMVLIHFVFRCDSYCGYIPAIENTFMLKEAENVKNIMNSGDEAVFPSITLENKGNDAYISIKNMNNNSIFTLDILQNETLILDMENMILKSNIRLFPFEKWGYFKDEFIKQDYLILNSGLNNLLYQVDSIDKNIIVTMSFVALKYI